MPKQYACLDEVTVGAGGAASINFTSIPSTYTDLAVMISMKSTNSSWQGTTLRFNGTSSGYSDRFLNGDGSSATSGSNLNGGTAIYIGANPATAETNAFSNTQIYIPNYTSSSNKSVSIDQVSDFNTTLSFAALIAGLWQNTAAITSIAIAGSAGNLAQYTTATLYGIKNS
jgi:hypothetical protein